MSLAILFHFLCAQHVSDINMSIITQVPDDTYINVRNMLSTYEVK